ncbi:TPA: hypothetical protein GM645_00035 [Klebsiella pneumoniae]|nr:hypothetical protein [Klebsiella pneumoniae]HBX0707456.1 hypothetical protein [Klebsiella pneumoniae]HCB0969496.1 hypothetical protein [Klebsiella pneumoniae]HCB1251198.1 hypothetical protein [Klebsiella pneumoniae]
MKRALFLMALLAPVTAFANTTGFTCTTQGLTAGNADTRAYFGMAQGHATWKIAGYTFEGMYQDDKGTVLKDGNGNTLTTDGATDLNADGSYTQYLIIRVNGKDYTVDCGADKDNGEITLPMIRASELGEPITDPATIDTLKKTSPKFGE